MTVALKCDGCGDYTEFPFAGWLDVEPAGPVQVCGVEDEFHVCSWKCLVELGMQRADLYPDVDTTA